jgi:hypothetical protein
MFFRPLSDGTHSLALSPIMPSDWTDEQKERCWSRWFEPAWPEYRPSMLQRLRSYANDRDHCWW